MHDGPSIRSCAKPCFAAARSSIAVSSGEARSSIEPQTARKRLLGVPLKTSFIQVTLGGIIVATVGILVGHA